MVARRSAMVMISGGLALGIRGFVGLRPGASVCGVCALVVGFPSGHRLKITEERAPGSKRDTRRGQDRKHNHIPGWPSHHNLTYSQNFQ